MFRPLNANRSKGRIPTEGRIEKRRKRNQCTFSFSGNHPSIDPRFIMSEDGNGENNTNGKCGSAILQQPPSKHVNTNNLTSFGIPITEKTEHTDAIAYHAPESPPKQDSQQGGNGQEVQEDPSFEPINSNLNKHGTPITASPEHPGAIASLMSEQLPEEHYQDGLSDQEDQENLPLITTNNINGKLAINKDRADTLHHVARLSFRYVLKWERLLAFVAIAGSEHFTASGLVFVSKAISSASGGSSRLPTYKTVRSTQWNHLVAHLFVPSSVLHIGNNCREGHRSDRKDFVHTVNNGEQDPRDCIRMVLPSSWAKLDCVTLPIYNDLFNTQRKDGRISINIEHAPLVYDCDRRKYLSVKSSIWARYKKTVIPSSYSELLHYPVGKLLKYSDNDMEDDHWFIHTDSKCHLRCKVGPSWCVRARIDDPSTKASIDQDMTQNMNEDELLAYLYAIYATHQPTDFNIELSKKAHAPTTTDEVIDKGDRHNCPLSYDKLFTFPGDLCVILRQEESIESAYIVLFIASHIWREQGRIGERIIWLNRTQLRQQFASKAMNLQDSDSYESDRLNRTVITNLITSDQCTISQLFSAEVSAVDVSQQVSVTGLPSFPKNFEPSSIQKFSRSATNKGYLQDGTPYLVYRFFLYADGFQQKKSISDKRSITGCYILPAGLPHQAKSTCTCVRTLTVSPDGLDPNDVLRHIVDDIIEGTVQGIDSYDAHGRKVKIFLDNISELNDTPAQASGNDVMGHIADSFCAFCGARKRKGLQTPPISFSTSIHCRRPSLMRCDERMVEIRASPVHEDVRQHLGTKCSTESDAQQRIKRRIAIALQSNLSKKIFNDKGDCVLDFYYDSYQSAAVAPDHLFKGLITNALTVCFNTVEDTRMRSHIDKLICREISNHNLPSIDTVLNWDKHGKYNGINNVKMSSLFCILLFAGPIFKSYGDHVTKEYEKQQLQNGKGKKQPTSSQTGNGKGKKKLPSSAIADGTLTHPFDFPQELQDIISISYWCPQPAHDPQSDIEYVLGTDDLKPLDFYGEIQELSDRYIKHIRKYYKDGGPHAKKLDKPNAHKLQELAYHTIPAFGHALNVSELVLEQAHRTSKTWHENNTHSNAHMTGVELNLAKDWMNRVYAHYVLWVNGNDEEKESSIHGLARLLLGAIAAEFQFEGSESILEELKDRLQTAFQSPVLDTFPDQSSSTLLPTIESRWELFEKGCTSYERQYLDGVNILKSLMPEQQQSTINFQSYAIAKLQRKEQYCSHHRTSTFNNIHIGSCVSLTVYSPSASVLFPTEGGPTKVFVLVNNLVKAPDGSQWGFGKQFTAIDDRPVFTMKSTTPIQIFRLTNSVTRVGRISAKFSFDDISNYEPSSVDTDGAEWTLLTSRQGYPPRMG